MYEQWWERLYTYLHRIIADRDDAYDICQEAFIRLYARGSVPEEPGAWLVSVANNLLRDRSRTRRRRSRILLEHRGDVPVGGTVETPDASIEREEIRQQVRVALDALPLRQRQVLLLRASGMKYRQIAAALDMPVTSVGQTLARAMKAFRENHRERG